MKHAMCLEVPAESNNSAVLSTHNDNLVRETISHSTDTSRNGI